MAENFQKIVAMFDQKLKIFDKGDYGCSKFEFCPLFPQTSFLPPPISHYWMQFF